MRRFHPALLSISLLSFLFVCCSTERAFFLLFRCASSSSSSYKRVSDHLFTAGKRGKKNGSSTRFSMSLSPSTLLPFGLVLFRLVFFFIFSPLFYSVDENAISSHCGAEPHSQPMRNDSRKREKTKQNNIREDVTDLVLQPHTSPPDEQIITSPGLIKNRCSAMFTFRSPPSDWIGRFVDFFSFCPVCFQFFFCYFKLLWHSFFFFGRW